MYATLITVAELAPVLGHADWCVLDCRYDLAQPDAGAAQYAAGHIPGASYVDLARDLSGPRTPASGRHPLPEAAALVQRLGALGIDEHVQVVAYDASAGLYASRAWWLLRALGHGAVAVLDGGLPAWLQAGGSLSTQPVLRAPRRFPWAGQALAHRTADDVAAGLAARTISLVDVRSAERFEGRSEPLDPVAGHIPGACNLPQSRSLAADGRFLDPVALGALFAAQPALRRPEEVVCMCGSGVTACHTLLAMEVAGLPGGRLYPGSWSEWCRDPARPVATGPA